MKRLLSIIFLALAISVVSCNGGGGGGSPNTPVYDSWEGPFMYADKPAEGEDWVEPTAEIYILITNYQYETNPGNTYGSCSWLDTASVNTSTFLVHEDMGSQVLGTINVYNYEVYDPWDGKWYCGRDWAAVFTPTTPLKTDAKYNVKLTKDIRVNNGAPASKELNFSFTTGPQGVGTWLDWSLKNGLPPAGRAFWTGSEILVWDPIMKRGGFYNPSNDTWREISSENAPPAFNDGTVLWTGTEVIAWFGGTGGRYNPSTDIWVSINTVNAPRTIEGSDVVVWTGTEMIVVGGYYDNSSNEFRKLGGRYNPATDSWASIDTVNAPYIDGQTAIWTGTEMIVWGGMWDVGGRYNPKTNSWASLSNSNEPSPRIGHTAVWTGTEMIIWGGIGWSEINGYEYYNSGGHYNPTTDSWTTTSMEGVPPERANHLAVWTGSRMLVYGQHAYGGIYDPLADTWTAMAPTPFYVGQAPNVWSGDRLLLWGFLDGPYGVIYVPPPQ